MVDSDTAMRIERARHFLYLAGRPSDSVQDLAAIEAEMSTHPAARGLPGVYIVRDVQPLSVEQRWYAATTPAKATQ
jgi:hypothetical protein